MTIPLRVRLTIAYVLTAGLVAAAGGAVFWASVESGLQSNRDEHLRSRTVRLVTVVERFGPSAVGTSTPAGSDMLIELVRPDGGVDRTSPALDGAPLLDPGQLAAVSRGGRFLSVGPGPAYRLYAAPAPTAAGTWFVIVATPLQMQNDLSAAVTRTLVIAATALVVAGAVGAWFLATAALRPVERLRREVARLSETEPSAGVHVPPTGDELAALAATMNDLLARSSAALARQRQFVADASHEIRTPLANLRTTLELAASPSRTRDELLEAVRQSEREVMRLGHLVDDLLVLAAADDQVPLGRLPEQPVRPLLEAAAAAAGPAAATRGVALRVDAPGQLAASFHEGQLRQVLDNLVGNALRHAPAGSEVVLRATAAPGDEGLLIEVLDEGPGFPAGFAEHAFERFRRADPGRSRDGGRGLGLAVVQAIARAHGGTATAGNRPGGGAIVQVCIPCPIESGGESHDENGSSLPAAGGGDRAGSAPDGGGERSRAR